MTEALVLIDIQTGVNDPVRGGRNTPDADDKAAALQAAWRMANRPLCHIRHVGTDASGPPSPGNGGAGFNSQAAPVAGEGIIEKSVSSAFIGPGLAAHLQGEFAEALPTATIATMWT